ncbi:MAG: LPS export ABC transporter periplasmic protein LptC [Desulfobulbus propionicus]|nr:MAG: LPS export ABC transporter periplasmic protein LptC [Desulfobulbus propionicus]
MIKKTRDLLWAIPLAFFLTSPLWKPALSAFLDPGGNFEENAQLQKMQKSQGSKHFKMDSVEITLTSDGQKEWQINAEKAYTGKSDQEILMENVFARYIGQEKPPTNITSRQGKYYVDKRHLVLIEDVVIEKPQANEVLYTDLLHYYDATKMVVSPGQVFFKSPNFQLRGGRMDYDLATDGYDFSDRVIVDL